MLVKKARQAKCSLGMKTKVRLRVARLGKFIPTKLKRKKMW